MSNAFINRNRSQGGYGQPMGSQKFQDADQTWYSRATKPDKFYNTSLKYSSNLDLQSKKVPFMWTMNDSQAVFRQDANPNRVDNAVAQKWKEFNSYETQDIRKIQREDLIQEQTV